MPELGCVMANLEWMPLRMNESKKARIGPRQMDLAKRLPAVSVAGPNNRDTFFL